MVPLRRCGWTGRWVVVALVAIAGACAEEVPVELRPDGVLRDSLGLTDDDAVHVVLVDGAGGRDVATPARVRVRPGERVSFTTVDGRLHHVRFDTAAMAPETARWIVDGERVLGPPLVSRDSRWVVDFSAAPEGIYPFRLEGNGAPGGGVIEVTERRR